MKRSELLRHLRQNGCVFVREGSRHSWWLNPEQNKRSSVLAEFFDSLYFDVLSICPEICYYPD